MKKINILLSITCLSLVMYGCGANQKQDNKTADLENTYFDELNAAAKKNSERKNLRVDAYYPEYEDIDCSGGKKEIVKYSTTRTVSDYDFANNRSITYLYASHNADDDSNDKEGMVIASDNGIVIQHSFTETNGVRTLSTKSEEPMMAMNPMSIHDFEGVVADKDRSLYSVTRKSNKDTYVYTMTMKDPDKLKASYQKHYEDQGLDYLEWNSCSLHNREEKDLKLVYHVNKEGILTQIDTHTVQLLDDFQKTSDYTVTYGSYEKLNEMAFKE